MSGRSILEQVRTEAYRDGVSTISQVATDEAFEEGRLAGFQEALAQHRRWGWFCFLAGIGTSAIAFGLLQP